MTATDTVVELSKDRIAKGSKSFSGAARLFDDTTRDYAVMLYAWCRHCDDVIDDQVLGFAAAEPSTIDKQTVLAALRAQTLHAIHGHASDPIFVALQRVVRDCQIPERHPMELLDGFAMDVEERQYETIDDTLAYCYHVAGVVGVMMAMIMGVRARDALNRASDLGIAFQLTNIARDVIADAETGRVYLPGAWLDDEAIPRDRVADPMYRDAVSRVIARLLDTADQYYRSSGEGIRQLPFRSAWAIATARQVYREIGVLVRRRGATAWDKRVVVSRPRKLAGASYGALRAGLAGALARLQEARSRDGLWTKPGLGS
jgi:15-cis-phytoene synthase